MGTKEDPGTTLRGSPTTPTQLGVNNSGTATLSLQHTMEHVAFIFNWISIICSFTNWKPCRIIDLNRHKPHFRGDNKNSIVLIMTTSWNSPSSATSNKIRDLPWSLFGEHRNTLLFLPFMQKGVEASWHQPSKKQTCLCNVLHHCSSACGQESRAHNSPIQFVS